MAGMRHGGISVKVEAQSGVGPNKPLAQAQPKTDPNSILDESLYKFEVVSSTGAVVSELGLGVES
jgi:hypothetical protein